MNRCILLLVDGLRPDLAEQQLAAGTLPNLKRLLERGGATRAITSFPSTTSVSYLPFLTGCLPGRCNVPSIRWLDRTQYRGRWWKDRTAVRSYCGYQAGMLDQDLAPEIRTIFELVPESAGFFTMVSRGLTPDRDPAQFARRFWGTFSHYIRWHQPGDDAVARHLLQWIDRDASWRFLFAQFPAVDGCTHHAGPDAPSVLKALRRFDTTVGDLTATLARHHLADDTLILMVSDHGATAVHHHLDLADWFRAQGVPTVAHPELWRAEPRAAVMVAGNGSAMVYALPDQPRAARWSLARLRDPVAFGSDRDLIAALVCEPAVAFVAAEDPDGVVRVADRNGEATIRQVGVQIDYRIESADPLAIGESTVLSQRRWLDRTFDGSYPDGPVQLLDQFRSLRTGDLVVIGRQGFDFRDRWEIPEHKAGHGSLFKDHMQTPLWSNQPTEAARLRTADLFVSILHWLGERMPAGIDGEPVWLPQTNRAVAERGAGMHLSAPGILGS